MGVAARSALYVWLLLVGLSVYSTFATAQTAFAPTPFVVTTTVLAIGFFKVWLVARYFMHIGAAPRFVSVALAGWIAIVFTTLLLLYAM